MRFKEYLGYLAAILFAALAPAAVFGFGSAQLATITFTVALGHALVLGLPAVWLGWATGRITLITSIVGGFVVGAIPIGVISWPLLYPDLKTSAWSFGVPTMISGAPTLAGWFNYAAGVAFFGAFGAIGGFVFWVVLKWVHAPMSRQAVVAKPSRDEGSRGVILAGTAVLFTGLVFAIPAITKDRTCHNMLRDGRDSIGPQVSMDLPIDVADWTRLTKLFLDFAAARGMSFRDSTQNRPNVMQAIYLSACGEQVNVTAMQQRWSTTNTAIPNRGISIGIYEQHDGSDWKQIARDLIAEIELAWPGKLQFRGRDGGVVPMPPELQGADTKAPAAIH